MRFAIIGVIAIVGMLSAPQLAAVSLIAPEGVIDAVQRAYGGSLSTFTVQPMDRDALLADALDGKARITLGANTYDLLLTERNIIADPVPRIALENGESMPDPAFEFPTRIFSGSVVGEPDSRALLSLTQIGASGYVRVGEQRTHFQPAANQVPNANDLHIVFPHSAMDFGWFVDEDDVIDADVTPEPGAIEGPITIQQAATPRALLKGDLQFMNAYSSCWWCKMDNTMAHVDDIYTMNFAWSITTDGRFVCTTQAMCDSQGLSASGSYQLRNGFANYEYNDWLNNPRTWTQAILFSGRDFTDSPIGVSYLAGRYNINQFVDIGTYDGGSIDYEGGVLVAHEAGHNFRGRHQPDARSYSHCHYWVGSSCWDQSTHYTIMYTPFNHEPSTDNEMLGDFNTSNINAMNACNDGTWAALSFAPANRTCT